MDEKNLRKYMIDTTAEIYASLNLSDVTVTNYVGDQNISGMPALAMLMNQNKEILKE